MRTDDRSIKTHLIIFTIFLVGLVAGLAYLFQENKAHFNKEVYEYSKSNSEIIEKLSVIGTNLYIHKHSLLKYINSGEHKYFLYLGDAKSEIFRLFEVLENFNERKFELWVRVPMGTDSQKDGFSTAHEKEGLKQQIEGFQQGHTDEKYFQRLFYLVRYNLTGYFAEAQQYLDNPSHAPGQPDLESLPPDIEEHVDLIYRGINQIITIYNDIFWGHTLTQNSFYYGRTTLFFRALMTVSFLLLFYALFICTKIFRYLRRQSLHELKEKSALIRAQDVVTGLLNRESFEVFTKMEMARAKRQGYPVCLIFVVIDDLALITKNLGEGLVNEALAQLALIFDKGSRVYDRVYRYENHIFTVVMPETGVGHMNMIIKRFLDKISQDRLLKKMGFSKNLVKISFVSYPADGNTLEELMAKATREFLGRDLAEPVNTNNTTPISTALPVDKVQGPSVSSSAMIH